MTFRRFVPVAAMAAAIMLIPLFLAGGPTSTTPAQVTLASAEAAQSPATTTANLSQMPLAFTRNDGQWEEWVRFRASGGGVTLWLGRDGITYQFSHRVPRSKTAGNDPLAAGIEPRPLDGRTESDSIESVVVHAAFVGGNPAVEPVGENPLEYRCNYFLGNDPSKWRTDVPNYAAIVYRDVYPGVDLRYEGKGRALTCSFAATSGSDLAQVQFRYEGFDSAHPEGDAAVTETGPGQFRMEAPWGAMLEPFSGQSGGFAGNAPPVAASAPEANGATPVALNYSILIGGSDWDEGHGIAVDQAGCAYVTGWTYSASLLPPPLDPSYDRYFNDVIDAFVTKLAAAGNVPVYSTYLGGSDVDAGFGIAVDQLGCAYVTGWTSSANFPLRNPWGGSSHWGGYDVFVTKLNAAGNDLAYSTFLGGRYNEMGTGIAVDQARCAHVTGWTYSYGSYPGGTYKPFPTWHGYDNVLADDGHPDVFVVKLDPSLVGGASFLYGTFLGGGSDDWGNAIAVDQNGCAYVTGETWSSDFPTQSAVDYACGGNECSDAFVAKLNPALTGSASLIYSSYLGGGNSDIGYGIAVDQAGSAYVAGITSSTDFPLEHPYADNLQCASDAFVSKLAPWGKALVYSTFLGGHYG